MSDALKEAIAIAGGQTALAAKIGRKQQNIWDWLHNSKRVPAEAVLPIEAATGVSRHRLRPDLYPLAGESGQPPATTSPEAA